jgi:hypothetical protein
MKLPFAAWCGYSRHMTELDQIWLKMLDERAKDAHRTGNIHLADYLRLRATNDAIRTAGVSWLLDSLIDIAAHASRDRHGITIERKEPHNFSHGSSNMTGSLVEVRQGVRCLSAEAGWARVPSDGIMRNGALACARITHFGIPKAGAEFRLVHAESLPKWLETNGSVLDGAELNRHLQILLGG